MSQVPNDLLATIATYSSVMALFFGIITVIVSIVALVDEKKIAAIITTSVVSLNIVFPGFYRRYHFAMTIHFLMKVCILLSAMSMALLLALIVAEQIGLPIDFDWFKQLVGAAEIVALFLFVVIALNVPLIVFELGHAEKKHEDYTADLEI